MMGTSSSSNYPTPGGYDQTFNNGWQTSFINIDYVNGCDIVISKFNSNGTALLASTYIGGTDNEGLNESIVYNYSDEVRGEVVLDNNDNVYVASSTWSDDFPVTIGAGINGGNGFGNQDAIVFKMNSSLSTLLWSTYLGGTSVEAGYSIRCSEQGKVFVCGSTNSSNFGATPGVINTSLIGSTGTTFSTLDGFIASFAANSGATIARTYIGTSLYDQAFILEIDENENVYVVGQTLGNYPVVNAAYSNNNSAQFIHKLNPALTATSYSTIFGSGSLSGPSFNDVIDISLTLSFVRVLNACASNKKFGELSK